MKIIAYHGSAQCPTCDDLLNENHSQEIGIHFGSKKAAVVAANKFKDAEEWDAVQVDIYFNEHPECFIEVKINAKKPYFNATDSEANSDAFKSELIKQGHDCIGYINEFEDIGSISYVVLDNSIIEEI